MSGPAVASYPAWVSQPKHTLRSAVAPVPVADQKAVGLRGIELVEIECLGEPGFPRDDADVCGIIHLRIGRFPIDSER